MVRQLSLFDPQHKTKPSALPATSNQLTMQVNTAFAVPSLEVQFHTPKGMETRSRVISPDTAQEIFRSTWPPNTMNFQEVFRIMFLNRNHAIIGVYDAFRGGISATVIDPKIVMGVAVQVCASSFICAHNHPSGNLQPSQADIQITQKLQAAGMLLDIKLLDHMIFSPHGSYYSMADEGKLPQWPQTVAAAAHDLNLDWG